LPETELLGYLIEHGDVVQVSDDVVLLNDAYEEATRRIVGHLQERETITLAEVRDLLGTSRKYAQAILENLDEERVTRRLGDQRILRPGEGSRP
jgi:selenocysteine-specific elongation factor